MPTQSISRTSPSGVLPTQRVLRRVLRTDPSQEYYVYIPRTGGAEAPVLVSVHGVSRNAREHARLFAGHCEKLGVVLVAPHFDAKQYRDYQRLGRIGQGKRADATLNQIVADVAAATGAAAEQIHLFGYSGGAQFVHRYAMLHPERVARAVVASAGWYTFPDARTRYPYGIRPTRKFPGVRFDPEGFLRVPIAVLVGENDGTKGKLRRSKRVNRQQGVTRVERARSWVEAMKGAADAYRVESLVSFEELANSSHSFRQCIESGALADKAFGALFGSLSHVRPQPERGGNGRQQPTRWPG